MLPDLVSSSSTLIFAQDFSICSFMCLHFTASLQNLCKVEILKKLFIFSWSTETLSSCSCDSCCSPAFAQTHYKPCVFPQHLSLLTSIWRAQPEISSHSHPKCFLACCLSTFIYSRFQHLQFPISPLSFWNWFADFFVLPVKLIDLNKTINIYFNPVKRECSDDWW